MSEVFDMSTFDLYAEVRYVNERLDTNDKFDSPSWVNIQELLEYKKELIEEINRRDNERFR